MRRFPDASSDRMTDAAESGPQLASVQRESELAAALRTAVVEVEAHVSADGWDAPARLFALVPTRELAAAEPELAAELGIVDGNTHRFTPVEQELEDQSHPVERLLARISWPPAVHGAVVAVERVVLPPEAEADVPEDPDAAAEFAGAHAGREDVRMTVGVLRSGESHCVIRLRSRDVDAALVQGADVVPALVAAVRETLEVGPPRGDGRPRSPRGD